MTPKQRHREGVFARDHQCAFAVTRTLVEDGNCPVQVHPRWLFLVPGGCRGDLQAAHIISVQRLKKLHGSIHRAGDFDPLQDTPLDDLIADPRNGVLACEIHHQRHEGPILHMDEYPAHFWEFVSDYGLQHVVEHARGRAPQRISGGDV